MPVEGWTKQLGPLSGSVGLSGHAAVPARREVLLFCLLGSTDTGT
jgi:hypothetical protein